MNEWVEPALSWFCELYVLATIVLTAAWLATRGLRQPARRLLVARSALASLVLLAPLTAGARGARTRWFPEGTAARPAGSDAAGTLLCPCSVNPSALQIAPPTNSSTMRSERAGDVGAAVLVAWLVGSGAIVAWLGLGAIALARLAGRTGAASERLRGLLVRVVGEGVRPPRLAMGAQVAQPMAVGLIRPTIVLPARFAETEPDDRIEAALAHEWAHIRNGDLWMLAASRLLLPLLFAHPLYAWLRRGIRNDQEVLADAEAAARQGHVAYAEALLCWSRAVAGRAPNRFAPSLGLWGRSSLTARIGLLLDRDFRVEPSCPRSWRRGIAAAATALVVGLGLASATGAADLSVGRSGTVPPRAGNVLHLHSAASAALGNASRAAARWDGRCKN